MSIKKIIAVLSASALSVSILAASAFAAEEVVVVSDGSIDFTPTAGDYEYAGYIGSITGNSGNVLSIDITAGEGADLSTLRLEFTDPKKVCWASQNDEGTLYTTDGKTLIETEFAAGETTTVYIDLVKSEASASDFHVHTSGTDTGAFKLENITLLNVTDDEESDETDNKNSEESEETSDSEESSEPEETSDDSAASGDNSESGKPTANTGIEGVAIVAGVAVIAAGVVFAAKKRK